MRNGKLAAGALSLASTLSLGCQYELPLKAATSYSAAFINNAQLTVFPWAGSPVTSPVPTGPSVMQYSSDGMLLYASHTSAESDRSEIQKVDIRTGRAAQWLSIPGFTAVVSFAVARDESKIIISGRYREASELTCGVFEMILRRGTDVPRVILHESGGACDVTRLWRDLSLSPDGEQVVAWKPGPADVGY